MPSIRITAFKSLFDQISDEEKRLLARELRIETHLSFESVGLEDIEAMWLPPIDEQLAVNTCALNIDVQFSTGETGVSINETTLEKLAQNLLTQLKISTCLPFDTELGIWIFTTPNGRFIQGVIQ